MAPASRTYGADRVSTGLGNIETGWQRVRMTAWRLGMRSRPAGSRPTDPYSPGRGSGSCRRHRFFQWP